MDSNQFTSDDHKDNKDENGTHLGLVKNSGQIKSMLKNYSIWIEPLKYKGNISKTDGLECPNHLPC